MRNIMLPIKDEILFAERRIRPYIQKTPLVFSKGLSRLTGVNVFLKYENVQPTGAFKVRGAFNKLLSLTPDEQQKGVVTASSGNHGAAVACGLSTLKLTGKVFVPVNASRTKIENIQNYSIPLEFYGTDCMQTEMHALSYAKEHNQIYVSPYNDVQVIAGQGTIGLELTSQLEKIDAILAPVGGGGLISGIAAYIKAISPETEIVGCLPANSPVMAESIKAGKIVEMNTLPTLSDATAGGIEPGAITFELYKMLVDNSLLVSEDEIQQAIVSLIKMQHILVEGAAGVAMAALMQNAAKFQDKNVVVVLSGANMSFDLLKKVITEET